MMKHIKMKHIKWSTLLFVLALSPLLGFRAAGPEVEDIVDIFNGTINQPDLEQVTLLGSITYDRNCIPVDGGLTQCDAGVKTEEYGVINFNYTHNMSEEPCLIDGNKVLLKVRKDQQASVVR